MDNKPDGGVIFLDEYRERSDIQLMELRRQLVREAGATDAQFHDQLCDVVLDNLQDIDALRVIQRALQSQRLEAWWQKTLDDPRVKRGVYMANLLYSHNAEQLKSLGFIPEWE